MAKKQSHAEHNRNLAIELNNGKTFYDWCVTTAFYSALHFVDLKILPFELGGKSCSTLKDAKALLNSSSKHKARMDMVVIQCPKIKEEYRWLMDNANNARYVTFRFNAAQSAKALQYLKIIEDHCAA